MKPPKKFRITEDMKLSRRSFQDFVDGTVNFLNALSLIKVDGSRNVPKCEYITLTNTQDNLIGAIIPTNTPAQDIKGVIIIGARDPDGGETVGVDTQALQWVPDPRGFKILSLQFPAVTRMTITFAVLS